MGGSENAAVGALGEGVVEPGILSGQHREAVGTRP
jgi:hypothetical protein